jgi:hypothetical protein
MYKIKKLREMARMDIKVTLMSLLCPKMQFYKKES